MANLAHQLKLHLCFAALLLVPFLLPGQSRFCIKKTYAYYSIANKNQSPKGGGIEEPTLFDTNKVAASPLSIIEKDTSILIYIEAHNGHIKWVDAQQGRNLFSITPIQQQGPLQPGFTDGGGPITITGSKGSVLYALQLTRKKRSVNNNKWTLQIPLLLKGTCSGKPFVLKISSLKKINTLPPA